MMTSYDAYEDFSNSVETKNVESELEKFFYQNKQLKYKNQ